MNQVNFNNDLTNMLNIDVPIIMAPMFLVSNAKMTIEAINSGITGCIPALNYRTIPELRKAILEVQENCKGPLGINLIVNKLIKNLTSQDDWMVR